MINRCVLTFHQCLVFNGKTHSLQTRKYDVIMTSPMAKIFNFLLVEYLFRPKHSLKILQNCKHFQCKYKQKCEWVFFSERNVCDASVLFTTYGAVLM